MDPFVPFRLKRHPRCFNGRNMYKDNFIPSNINLTCPHIHHTSDAVSCLHILESSVDLGQWLAVSDEFVNLQFASHVIVHQIRQLRTTFNAASIHGQSQVETLGEFMSVSVNASSMTE